MEILIPLAALIAIGFIIWREMRKDPPESTDTLSEKPRDTDPPAPR